MFGIDSTAVLWILIAILVMLSAFFSGTETAFSSLNKVRLTNLANAGDKRAARAVKISENFDRALSAILIGNNIVNIASASIGTILFTQMLGPAGAGVSTLVMTLIVLTFGEILPKSIAKENAEKMALAVSGILHALMVVLTPLIMLFVGLKKLVSKLYHSDQKEPSVTEQELKFIIDEIQQEGVLEEQESELVQSALDFDDITVGEILTPRVDVISISVEDDVEKVKSLFVSEPYSRLVVYEESVDDIVGILHEKDFFKSYVKHPESLDIRSLMQPTIFVPPTKKISTLLKELQKLKSHIAVVTDQYGGTLGIVTLEDILEELVGEIWDENDEVVHDIVPMGENTFQVNPDMNISDLFEELMLPEPECSSSSVGGWVLDTLEKIPKQGDSFEYETLRVTVSTVEEQRITQLIVTKLPAQQEEAPQDEKGLNKRLPKGRLEE